MPGRLELRREREPMRWSAAGFGRPRSFVTREVWVENPPLYGRSEFNSEREAREWVEDVRELDLLRLRARRGDRMAQRRADALQSELDAIRGAAEQDRAFMRERGGNTMIIDDLSDFVSPVTSGTALERWFADNSLVSRTYNHQHSLDAIRYAWLHSNQTSISAIPAELKKQLDDIKTMVEPDPYLGPVGTFAQSYISIPKSSDNNYVQYWRTDGRISQYAVARVLSRYYATAEHVAKLTRVASGNNRQLEGVETIHPDILISSAQVGWCRLNSFETEGWFRDTHNLPALHWNGTQWLRRVNNERSINGFKIIDPHGVFQE